MNGLKALPGGRATLQLAGTAACFHGKCDSGENSMECVDDGDSDYDECDSLPIRTDESDGANYNCRDEQVKAAAEIDRDVLTFFLQFLPNSSASSGCSQPLQPNAVLQSRYNTLQHKFNKQAEVKSIKEWFSDKSQGKSHEPWWTSEVVIPSDSIAKGWGLTKSVHSSGQLHLTRSEMEVLKKEYDGKDVLLDLCGKYRLSPTNNIEFKSKKAAQKSAVINLLLAMDLGNLPTVEGNPKNDEPLVLSDASMVQHPPVPKERFQLESIKYYGAAKNEGELLSCDNPCMVQCIVSVKDNLNQSVLEVITDFHQHEDDSLRDAFDKIRSRLLASGATSTETDSVFSAIKESKPNIGYEMILPPWATAPIEPRCYLYELEFNLCNGSDSPLAATRMGILLGEDLNCPHNFELCADLTFTSPMFTADSNDGLRVRMCSRNEITLSEMTQQIKRASPKIKLETTEGPMTLATCFNIILFDHGKNYGMGPMPVWGELLKRLDEGKAEPGNRTYLFLPLSAKSNTNDASESTLEIDWRLVWDVVHHHPTNVLSQSSIGVILSLLVGVACIPAIFLFVARFCTEKMSDWYYIPLLASMLSVAVSIAANTASLTPVSILRNRFLIQPIGFGGRVFIAKNQETASITSLSPLLPQDVIHQMPEHISNGGLHLSGLTHCRYYEQLWQYYIRYPNAPLLHALSLIGMPYAQHELIHFHRATCGKTPSTPTLKPSSQTSISNILATRGLLVPELTLFLPMPRDLLYLCNHASEFMSKIERAHTLEVLSLRLGELQSNVATLFQHEKVITVSTDDMAPIIDKATSICINNTNPAPLLIREHERLEALGDSVYLFFIVLNLFAKHSSSNKVEDYVLDEFDRVISMQGKNKALFEVAMQLGLHRIIHVGNLSATKIWRSVYKTGAKGGGTQTVEISRKQMSDVIESLLGATYLVDRSGCMTVGLLNEIGPYLPDVEVEAFEVTSSTWFVGKGTCLTEGYPFDNNSGWTVELTKIRHILRGKHEIMSTLQRKAAGFCQLVSKRTKLQVHIEMLQSDPTASLLLHCALFDDSIDDQEFNPETVDLEGFGNLRDKIFHVGNATLQLSIVSEIYQLYDSSTSGDIHLMKVILLSNDSLAYIFVKNGLHEYLFDTDADATILMQSYMKESDLLGAKEWGKHNGWIVPGGQAEFRRRIQQLHGDDSHPETIMEHPQYVGLAAGRLWGHKDKLPEEASGDLQFSMKCIVGALALAFGVRDAWDLLRPFFLEHMLLSPDELRACYRDISPLVSNYKKGRR
ncbi:hypothetical protein ACHAXR_013378 [Thalassiosira sp. AJA248-18]